MWLAQRALQRHLQGMVLLLGGGEQAAVLALFVLLFPGIVLHELSHWLVARLLGVRTGPISIGLERKRGGLVCFGSVQIGRADAVRESLIGLAPLLVGTCLVLLVAHLGLGLRPDPSLPLSAWPARLLDSLAAPDAWLWVYLLFALANAMLPSVSDRRAWGTVALYLALMLALAYLLVGIPRISADWLRRGTDLLTYLAFAFSLTTLLDGVVLLVLLLLQFIVGRLTGRRLYYR